MHEAYRRAKVACVGIAVIDYIYEVEHMPKADEKTRVPSYTTSGGGMSAGGAVAASKLGASVRWLGRTGRDAAADQLFEAFSKYDVDVSDVRCLPNVTTPHSIVLVDAAAERAIVACGVAGLERDAEWLPASSLAEQDAVLADIRWCEGAVKALEIARRNGIPGVLDADASNESDVLQAVSAASHVVFSRQGLTEMFGDTKARGSREVSSSKALSSSPQVTALSGVAPALRAARAYAPFVAVTLGSDGVAWLDSNGELRHLHAPAAVARETLGAGDVFHGAFAYALARKMTEYDALRFASIVAALKVSRRGGWASYPAAEEVIAQLGLEEDAQFRKRAIAALDCGRGNR